MANMLSPYYTEGDVTIYHGDCLDVLPSFPENSVDTVITDPPYGLGFMNKAWDHGVPGTPFWKEILRVAKPGAILMAFGGRRTSHRLACAIEDAGWEIKDTVMWVYGSGFPKSQDLSRAMDRAAGAEREVLGVSAYANRRPRKEYEYTQEWGATLGGAKTADITAPTTDFAKSWDGYGSGLKPSFEPILVAQKPNEKISSDEIHALTGWDHWHAPTLIRNTLQKRFEILKRYGIRLPSSYREVEILKDSKKALHPGTETCIDFLVRPTTPKRRKPEWKLFANAKPKVYRTWHTDCNAANALKWGVGGFWIDGGRIPTDENTSRKTGALFSGMPKPGGIVGGRTESHPSGRFPANLIHDGSEEVLRLFPKNAGGRWGKHGGQHPDSIFWGKGESRTDDIKSRSEQFIGDVGSAARFFYTAKASPSERGEFNDHPTVKPLALMKYLCTLTKTPTGGVLLDPFMGTGSTLLAALEAGRKVIGIDIEEKSCKIAVKRLKGRKLTLGI